MTCTRRSWGSSDLRTLNVDWEAVRDALDDTEEPEELAELLDPPELAVALPYSGCDNPLEFLKRLDVRLDPVSVALLEIHGRVARKVREWRPFVCPDVRAAREFTREVVAKAKAEFLAERAGGSEALDLCAGPGGDTLALAEHYSVKAVDREAPRIEALKMNAQLHARHSVEVIELDAVGAEPDADVVHADPGRSGAKDPKSTEPPATELRDKLSGVPHMIEVPPAVEPRPGTVVFSAAGEVRSVCWTDLTDGVAAVIAETSAVLEGPPRKPTEALEPEEVRYVIEQDPAVRKANLSWKLAEELDAYPTVVAGEETVLASEDPPDSTVDHVIRVVEVGEKGDGPPTIRSFGVKLNPRRLAELRETYKEYDIVYVTRAGVLAGKVIYERE
ncbi:hypothetical protein [Methanopyrus sp.]